MNSDQFPAALFSMAVLIWVSVGYDAYLSSELEVFRPVNRPSYISRGTQFTNWLHKSFFNYRIWTVSNVNKEGLPANLRQFLMCHVDSWAIRVLVEFRVRPKHFEIQAMPFDFNSTSAGLVDIYEPPISSLSVTSGGRPHDYFFWTCCADIDGNVSITFLVNVPSESWRGCIVLDSSDKRSNSWHNF
jgi:hypothetical protein